MRLTYSDVLSPLELQAEQPVVLCLENVDFYNKFCANLYRQIVFGEGKEFYFYDDKELDLCKHADLVVNYFDFDLNSRKIVQSINKQMQGVFQESSEYSQRFIQLRSDYCRLFADLVKEADVDLSFNEDLSFLDLLKLANVRPEINGDCFSSLLTYIELLAEYNLAKMLVLVNAKLFFNDEQIAELYKQCAYKKIPLLLVEHLQSSLLSNEKRITLDNDLCEL